MPSLPIPLIGSLILGFLLIKMWFVDRKHGALAALLALCAVQGLIISLAQHYRLPGMTLVQPITATLVPPMAWVAFQATAVRRFARADLVHLAGPLLALLCRGCRWQHPLACPVGSCCLLFAYSGTTKSAITGK